MANKTTTYTANGSGDSPIAADCSLKQDIEGLMKKVGSKELKVLRTTYFGHFQYDGKLSGTVEKEFTIRSEDSWEAIRTVAERHPHLNDYLENYFVEQDIELTIEQHEAVHREKKPTAGYTPGRVCEVRSIIGRLG